MNQSSVVMFGIPGMNTGEGQGYEAPPQTEDPAPMVPSGSAKFAPVIMIVLLVGGYIGLRWLMED